MNFLLVFRQLGSVAWLIGLTMCASVVWAVPALTGADPVAPEMERRGLLAIVYSVVVCGLVGFALRRAGRSASRSFYRKEAMAVVGLSWVLATFLGALPYWLSGTCWTVVPAAESGAETVKLPMSLVDALFESQSGFSTTGATVLTDIDNRHLVPRCILFWRSSTHFLGGLGIIVLFVAILGQGSAAKALMRAEIPGPSKEGSQERIQHTARTFAYLYCALNLVLAVILYLEGMTIFDAICHAFGTMATGGFSTHDASIGHYAIAGHPHAELIEYTVIAFMVLAGTNFTLMYFALIGRPKRLFGDIEWRTYMSIIVGVTALVLLFGVVIHHDLPVDQTQSDWLKWRSALRHGLFQVVAILTTTGYCTADFNAWNDFSRGVLLLLMFIGGCAGSTGGGMKVIRHILFVKVLGLEIEKSFRPSVVRHVRLGGEPLTDPDLRRGILVYFGLITFIFGTSWLLLLTIEPDQTWEVAQQPVDNKLIDSASAIAATLNNIGPGFGIVGARENYAHFSWTAKLLFVYLMMLGRLELYVILVLWMPAFWRAH